jgi:hypothetical protein
MAIVHQECAHSFQIIGHILEACRPVSILIGDRLFVFFAEKLDEGSNLR